MKMGGLGLSLRNGWRNVASKLRKVYFDTSVFLEHFLGQEGAQEAREALAEAESRLTLGHVSALVVAECVGAPKVRALQGVPPAERDRRIDVVRDYFHGSIFRHVDATARAGALASEYAIELELHGPDALHLALAKMSGCDELHAFDGALLRVGQSVPGLTVCRPYADQGQLGV